MDAALEFKNSQYFDITIDGRDLKKGRDLVTAVILSLFTDRRALPDDPLPYFATGRRGHWSDSPEVNPIEGDRIGSRLWLLSREKTSEETLNRAREYVDEALRWMVEDGVADRVSHDIFYTGTPKSVMVIDITIVKGDTVDRFQFLWDQLENAIVDVQASTLASLPGEPLTTEDGTVLTTESSETLILE